MDNAPIVFELSAIIWDLCHTAYCDLSWQAQHVVMLECYFLSQAPSLTRLIVTFGGRCSIWWCCSATPFKMIRKWFKHVSIVIQECTGRLASIFSFFGDAFCLEKYHMSLSGYLPKLHNCEVAPQHHQILRVASKVTFQHRQMWRSPRKVRCAHEMYRARVMCWDVSDVARCEWCGKMWCEMWCEMWCVMCDVRCEMWLICDVRCDVSGNWCERLVEWCEWWVTCDVRCEWCVMWVMWWDVMWDVSDVVRCDVRWDWCLM